MADRTEDYAIVGEATLKNTCVEPEMSAEACQAKSIQTARL